jgi:1-phosphofructokinase
VADTYGPPLEWALTQPLSLVKINRDEFDALTPPAAETGPSPDQLTALSVRSPVQTWIVTNGEKPVRLAEKGAPPRSFSPPTANVVSPTGSGDVLLACLLHARHHRSLPLEDALAYALPYAAANAAHPGIADFDLNNPPR